MSLAQASPVEDPFDPLDELRLVERARHDRDAFAELYRRYLPRIHAFAYRRCGSRPLAEDVTAATFEEALRSLPSFTPKGGGFGPWLFRIAANEIIDHYRADERARGRKGHRALTLLATPAVEDSDDLPVGGDDHGGLLAALDSALAPEPVLRPIRPGVPGARRWYPVLGMAAAVAAVLGAVGVVRDSGPGQVRVTSPATAPVELPEPPPVTTTTSTVAIVTPKPSVTTSTTAKTTATTSTTKTTTRPTTKTTTQPTTKTTIVPVNPKPTTTTTSGPAAGVATLRLESRYRDTTAKLQWSNYGGKDFGAYLVLRADGPAEPTYPANDATTVVATITGQWSVSYMETVSDPTSRRYRVVAVDREGRLIADSPVVTPQAF